MKKITVGIMFMLIMFLAACGESEDAQDVYQKALEAGEKIESAEVDMTMNQIIEGDPAMGSMEMGMDTKTAMTLDPLTMHQAGTITMNMDGMSLDNDMEMYLTNTDLYMYESMSQTWMKMSSDMMPMDLANMEQNPQEQLEMLESFIDEIDFSEEDDYYVFKYDGDGEELFELSQEIIKENFGEGVLGDAGVDIEEVLENMTVHSLYYEVHIDKKTYDTKKLITNMDLDITAEGETLSLQQEMTATYTGINTVDEIEVPQEVIDAAEEL
ncbi:hypothetical protein M3210_06090 [Oceanobacillus luteolus]|uniref:DUF6612 family protein n=1 Tax=Oceanobacillus luteolus TaxID=1274358 RepID=A0ABW4HMN0_9BACI|nr:DUF6612 family protein [Oceanobacillus luteolus]MCM3739837.1 hypothetical protein [Oceanobacillus luteolus]